MDKKKITDQMTQFKSENDFVVDFSFKSMTLNEVMNEYVGQFNSDSAYSFDFVLQNEYKTLNLEIALSDRNHFDIVDNSVLQMSEMWQPSGTNSDEISKEYADNEVIEMLYDVSRNQKLSHVNY